MPRAFRYLLALLCAGAVLVVATTVGFGATHRFVVAFWQDTVGIEGDLVYTLTNVVRKLFHVPAYALVAGLVYAALPRMERRRVVAFVTTMAVAVADETIQALNPKRSGSALDLLIDAVGALLGIWIAASLSRRREAGRSAPDAR